VFCCGFALRLVDLACQLTAEDFKACNCPVCVNCGCKLDDLNRSDVVNVCEKCLRYLER
jgi:hypothetical protein